MSYRATTYLGFFDVNSTAVAEKHDAYRSV
jgi:hypothetical protein